MNNKLTIIGGGITGLSAAYLAAKKGWDVTLLEGSSQVGGLARTFPIGGKSLELYYHHFFTHDVELLWLLQELNLSNLVEFQRTTMGIFRHNQVHDFNTARDLLKFSPMGLIDKVRFGLSSLYLGKLAEWQRWESAPALDWFYKYAGKRATESLWRPMLEIKFGPYASEIPVSWMVGRLRQRMSSRKGEEERLGYLKGSLQLLLDRLSERLQEMGVKLFLNAPIERLMIKDETLRSVETRHGTFSDGVFLSTIPTKYMAWLVKEDAPGYADELSAIEYFSALCLILELDRPLTHLYWLNVADSGFPFGGVIEHTNFIPSSEYKGSHIVYLSRYFAPTEPFANMTAEQIKIKMIESVKRINTGFDHKWIKNIYMFRTETAATVCDLNFSQKVPKCASPIKNLYLANMSHVYPDERSCNNSIRVAAQACKKIGIDSSMVPANLSISGHIGMD